MVTCLTRFGAPMFCFETVLKEFLLTHSFIHSLIRINCNLPSYADTTQSADVKYHLLDHKVYIFFHWQ